MVDKDARNIMKKYFGMENEDDEISWPLPRDEDRTIPMEYSKALKGYKSAIQYREYVEAIQDSNFDARSRNHLLMLHAAMLTSTESNLKAELMASES